MNYVAIIDFETTGMDPRHEKIIEGAVALVELADDRTLGRLVEQYSEFNDPGIPLSPLIIRLTGIDDSMVKGKKLDWSAFNAICTKATVLVAHNALFDRAFFELQGGFRHRWWACSSRMIGWKKNHLMPCGHLKHLAWEHDLEPIAHRAMSDVLTVYELLKKYENGGQQTYCQEMLKNAAKKYFLFKAVEAPRETKDILKQHGFRWNDAQRVWWKMILEEDKESVTKVLEKSVYGGVNRATIKGPVDTLDPFFLESEGLQRL